MKKYSFSELKQQYEDFQQKIETLAPYHIVTSITDQDNMKIDNHIHLLEQPIFNIVFVGDGQTAIINALLGQSPIKLPLTTEKVTVIKPTQAETTSVHIHKAASSQSYPLEILNELNTIEGWEAVNKIEIALSTWPLDKDIVLIHLPPRAPSLSDYFEQAQVSVVCFELGKVAKLESALQVGMNTKDIFWVINKWNTGDKLVKKQTLEAFLNLLKSNGLKIDTKKVYTLSADSYLTHWLSEQATDLTEAERTFIQQISETVVSKSNGKVVKDFKKFRQELLTYINQTAKVNYYNQTYQQLQYFEQKLLKELRPLFKANINVEDEFRQKMDELKFKKSRKIDAAIKHLIVEQHSTFFQSKKNFWDADRKNKIKTKLENAIQALFNNIGIHSKVTEYIVFNTIDIGAKTLVPEIPKILVNTLEQEIKTFVYDGYCLPLVERIQQKVAHYHLEDMEQELADACNLKYLNYRVRGFFDSVLHDYTEKVSSIVKTELTQDDNPTETYLNRIKTKIITYLQKIVDDLKVEHLVNNCFADIIQKLEQVDYQGNVFPMIEHGELDFKAATQQAIIAKREIRAVYEEISKHYNKNSGN